MPGMPPIDLKLSLSSLNRSIRQYFNRLSLHLSKDWYDLYLGDTYPDYSQYTLKGIPVRGGSIDIHPGYFRLAVALGQTKRAIEGVDNNTPNFRQTMHGFKIGYGKKNSSQINFNYVKFNDDENSIDSSGIVNPMENLVAGIDGILSAISGKLNIRGEISGSAYSRDIRGAEIDMSGEVPDFLTEFYTPRVSSQYGLAYVINPTLNLGDTKLGLTYLNIDPSFVSLGLAYNQNDIRKLGCSIDQRWANNKVFFNLKYFNSRDNLNDQKRATLKTNSGLANANIAFTKSTALNFGYHIYSQNNGDIEYDYFIGNINQSFIIGLSQRMKFLDLNHTISSNYSLTWYRDDKAVTSPGLNYDNHAFNLTANTQLSNSINLMTSWSRISNFHYGGGIRSDRSAYSMGAIHRAIKNMLTTNFMITYNTGSERSLATRSSDKISFSIRSNLRYKNTNASLKIEQKFFNDETNAGGDYNEFIIHFTITQTFGK